MPFAACRLLCVVGLAFISTSALSGCTSHSEAPTQLLIRVRGTVANADIEELTTTATWLGLLTGPNGAAKQNTQRYQGADAKLPFSFGVVPGDASTDAPVKLEVVALLKDGKTLRTAVQTHFREKHAVLVDVYLDSECLERKPACIGSKVCGACGGCVDVNDDGEVVIANDVSLKDAHTCPTPASEAGADASQDSGDDANAPTDGGSDSGSDAGVDAGTDASTDAGADADVDAAPPPCPEGCECVQSYSVGWQNVCAVTEGGALYCWGMHGPQIASDADVPMPRLVAEAGYRAVSVGRWHTCAITVGGDVECMGDNTYGQLGRGYAGAATANDAGAVDDQASLQVVLPNVTNAIEVAASDVHSCALTLNGSAKELWCWGGYDPNANSGVERSGASREPLRILEPNGRKWMRLSHGWNIAIENEDGQWFELSAWGNPLQGRGQQTHFAATATTHCNITLDAGLECESDGSVDDTGVLGRGTPDAAIGFAPVVSPTAGWTSFGSMYNSSCGVNAGAAYCWGKNEHGQTLVLGRQPTFTPNRIGTESDWSSAAAGSYFACGMRGRYLYCWGDPEDFTEGFIRAECLQP